MAFTVQPNDLQYMPVKKSELNSLSSYLSNYVLDDRSYEETTVHVVYRRIVTCLTILIGSVAGVPWVNSGDIVANRLACPPLYYVIGIGVVLSYGATSIWAFSEVVDKLLKPKSEEERNLLSSLSKKEFLKHIMVHLLGVLGAIPTFYLSYEYNSIKQYAILAGTIAYIFNVFGLYKLQDIFISLLKSYKSKVLQESHNITLSQAIEKILIPGITFEDANKLKFFSIKEFYEFLENKIAEEKNITFPKKQHCKYFFTAFMMLTFPTLDAIFISISISKAIASINQSVSLIVAGTFLTVLPLYGLDLFAVKESAYALYEGLHSNNLSKLTYGTMLIFSTVLCLSAFSALTNAYVAYDQIDASPLTEARFIFGGCTFLLTTALQTICFFKVIMGANQEIQAFFKPNLRLLEQKRNHLRDFSQLLLQYSRGFYEQHEQDSEGAIQRAVTTYKELYNEPEPFNKQKVSDEEDEFNVCQNQSHSVATNRTGSGRGTIWPRLFSKNHSTSGYLSQNEANRQFIYKEGCKPDIDNVVPTQAGILHI